MMELYSEIPMSMILRCAPKIVVSSFVVVCRREERVLESGTK